MNSGYENKELKAWLKNFQAEVGAFAKVSGLRLGGLATKLGYSASSAVTKNLDPNSRPTESFISRMSATFEGFSECWGEYLELKSSDIVKEVAPTYQVNMADRNDLLELKRSQISQAQKELINLYDDLEELIINLQGKNNAS